MKKGDYAFFYHSNCKQPGIVGIMEIVREHSVDGVYRSSRDPARSTLTFDDRKRLRSRPSLL